MVIHRMASIHIWILRRHCSFWCSYLLSLLKSCKLSFIHTCPWTHIATYTEIQIHNICFFFTLLTASYWLNVFQNLQMKLSDLLLNIFCCLCKPLLVLLSDSPQLLILVLCMFYQESTHMQVYISTYIYLFYYSPTIFLCSFTDTFSRVHTHTNTCT